jgi:hypothetical protein
MFSISITLDTSKLDSVIGNIPRKAPELVERGARKFEATAKAGAPVDTGNLQNRIEAKPISSVSWQIRDNTAYGVYQEFGVNHPYTINSPVNIKGRWVFIGVHPGFRAQPFWIPAAEAVRAPYFASFSELFA